MADLTLQATKRNVLGKKSRFLRHQGITPVHLFGHGIESLSLQCDTAELKKALSQAGKTRLVSLKIGGVKQPRNVLIREIQKDAIKRTLLHVDFYQVRMEEKIKADIPITLIGEAPAMKLKGRILIHGVTILSIECLPDRLPRQFEVDLSTLEDIEQAIYVKDITLGPDITLFTDPEQLVAKVSEARVEKVEEVAKVAVEEVAAEAGVPTEEKPEEAAQESAD